MWNSTRPSRLNHTVPQQLAYAPNLARAHCHWRNSLVQTDKRVLATEINPFPDPLQGQKFPGSAHHARYTNKSCQRFMVPKVLKSLKALVLVGKCLNAN